MKIPYTSLILFGATPKPVQAPAAVVFDEVTKGYVPKSISNKEPCAPSAKIVLLLLIAWFKNSSLSINCNVLNFSIPLSNSASNSSRSYSILMLK